MCSSSSGGAGAGAGWVAAGGAETYSTGLFSTADCGTFTLGRLGAAAASPAPLRQRNRNPPSSTSNSLNSFFETNSISSLISVKLGYLPTSFSGPAGGGAASAGPAALPGLSAGVVVVLCFVIKLKPQPGDAPHG